MARPQVVATVSALSLGSQMVAQPPHSVRPYAVVTLVMPSSSRIRVIRIGGTAVSYTHLLGPHSTANDDAKLSTAALAAP